jgi:glycosyltransferase involved in cell wall biosynthesis
MTVRGLRPRLQNGFNLEETIIPITLSASAAALAFATAVALPSAPAVSALALPVLAGVVVWMAISREYQLSLALLLFWLGLFDGFTRLKTGTPVLTLLRDALLYAIVVGWLIHASVRRDAVRLPPLSGWVIVFIAVVLVQLFNPANASLIHTLAALRPHLEWIPLFFLGYLVMRTRQRLRIFLVFVLLIAVINGAVATYQSRLSPDAFASWGPGYAERIYGTGDVSSRVGYASNAAETPFVRPFGLGSDFGFGGAVGVLAVPAMLALLALSRRRGATLAIVALAVGVVVAVATSQARTAVVSAVAAALAFLALASLSGRLRRALAALLAVGVIAFAVTPQVASIGGFNRYESISPSRVFETTVDYRRESLGKLPGYFHDFPLGAGIGSVGPATEQIDASRNKSLDAENEFNFLLLELGIPGLLVLTLFTVRVLTLATVRLRNLQDSELRLLLTGIAAPLFAIFLAWFVGTTTATSPWAPYFWFASGILSYWLVGVHALPSAGGTRRPGPPRGSTRVQRYEGATSGAPQLTMQHREKIHPPVSRRPRLVVVSHPCVLPTNQHFFACLEKRKYWHVTILAPERWKTEYGTHTARRADEFSGDLVPLPVFNNGNIPLHVYARRMARLLASLRPDVLFIHHEAYALATFQCFLAARRLRNVVIGFYSCQNLKKRYPPPFSAFERYVYRRADLAFAATDAVAEVLRSKGYANPVHLLPFGVDPSVSAGSAPERPTPNGPLTLGYVGRLSPEKGVDTLLEAMTELRSEEATGLLVGDGPERERLQRKASSLSLEDRLTWTGYVAHDQAHAIYRQIDMLVVPSRTVGNWKEQFGRVVIEALAAGVPVITSDSGELPTLIAKTDGGWTFPEGDADALAQVVRQAAASRSELRERGERGRAAVLAQYDIKMLAREFDDTLRKYLKR